LEEIVSMVDRNVTRRDVLRKGALGGLGLASLGSLPKMLDASEAFASGLEATGGIAPALVTAAQKDGNLNVITLPRNWANYGEIMDTFAKRYNIKITDAIPLGSSAQEVAAIKNLKGQNRAPDVVDVSPAWADKGKTEGLYVPYKVATWSTIPASMKDSAGYWWGDYYGVPAFMSVNSVVKEAPKDWPDLLSPSLKGMVSLGGDPRQAGEAFGAVFAASLGNGGSLDNIQPGIDFFAKLKKVGNFNPTFALDANVAKGATPVAIRWDYLLLASRDSFNGNPAVTINVPKSGIYAGYYCQAISKYAPYPNAAKLWQEYLYTDEVQLLFLKGYTHPARYIDLAKRGKIPAALASKLPPAAAYKGARFATIAQINAAQALLQEQWGPKVAGS
jgi:putative spermidine/putrescine transport system substrate-binding protein